MAPNVKTPDEDQFRSSFADLAVLLDKLGDVFPSTADLAAALELAATNDGQLRLLITQVTKK